MRKLLFHQDIQNLLYTHDKQYHRGDYVKVLKFNAMKIQDGYLHVSNETRTIIHRIKLDSKQKATLDGQKIPDDFQLGIDFASSYALTPSRKPEVTFNIDDTNFLSSFDVLDSQNLGFTNQPYDRYNEPEISYLRDNGVNLLDLSNDPIAKKKIDTRYQRHLKKWDKNRRINYFEMLENMGSYPNRIVRSFNGLFKEPIDNYYIHRIEGLQIKSIKKFGLHQFFLSPEKLTIGMPVSDIRLNHSLTEPTNMHANFSVRLKDMLTKTGNTPYDLIIPSLPSGENKFAFLKQVGFPFAEIFIAINDGSKFSPDEFYNQDSPHTRPHEEHGRLEDFYED